MLRGRTPPSAGPWRGARTLSQLATSIISCDGENLENRKCFRSTPRTSSASEEESLAAELLS